MELQSELFDSEFLSLALVKVCITDGFKVEKATVLLDILQNTSSYRVSNITNRLYMYICMYLSSWYYGNCHFISP